MATRYAPDTADGWAVLHQFFNVDWKSLGQISEQDRSQILANSIEYLAAREVYDADAGQTAAYHILGHKGGFLLLHFRKLFEECAQVELDISRLPLAEYLTLNDSYVSVVELGMYHTTKKIVEGLEQQGLKPYSPEWLEIYKSKIEPHRENLHERCYTEIPTHKYICFYPMNKARGEKNNWYAESIEARAEYMMEHGMTGRRFAGRVHQIISGSIGFDDWEWGVDLFADDPLAIKRLVYEMRFDDATALFGEFGKFYFGTRILSRDLGQYFSGTIKVPESSSTIKSGDY